MSRPHPFGQLFLARVREYLREPEVIFWMFGFPLLLTVALGIAFREKPADEVVIGVIDGPQAATTLAALGAEPQIKARVVNREEGAGALRMGRLSLLVEPGEHPTFRYDPTRPDAAVARRAANDALQRAAGRVDPLQVETQESREPGGRYIDFLIPGLMGMNIMGGGMWGVGFVLVDMRMRKLLKRLVATPMSRIEFLAAVIASRMVLVMIELTLVVLAGWLLFHVPVRGSIVSVALLVLLGAFTFCGMGLLVASRANKIETASGLMNLVMMPMWVCSGIFFSSERFPQMVQPLIKLLPLTALIDGLRAVVLEGASLASQWPRVVILMGWGLISFVAALRLFKWR